MNDLHLRFCDGRQPDLALEPGVHALGRTPAGLGPVEADAQVLLQLCNDRRGIWMTVNEGMRGVHVNGRPVQQVAMLRAGDSIHADGSWMTVFTTRIPDARGDAAEFRSKLRATQAELGVSGKAVRSRPDRNGLLRAGAAWVDRQGRGQGVWFMRRGEYVVEVRATFHPDDTDAVYAVLAALLRNEIPPPPARDDEDLG